MPFDFIKNLLGGNKAKEANQTPAGGGERQGMRRAAAGARGYDAQSAALSPNARDGEAPKKSDPYKVDEGQLTFDNEGLENPGGAFHSRIPHYPGTWSGVTIGRGYDMKERSAPEVQKHLVLAGVSQARAAQLARGAGLKGRKAKIFCRDNKSLEITPEQQKNLFEVVYGEKEAYARGRIKEWTGTDLDAADQTVQEMLVDLFYRGDMTYRKWKRHGFAKLVANNDYAGWKRLLATKSLWGNVDTNRYQARLAYLAANGPSAAPKTSPRPKPRPTQ